MSLNEKLTTILSSLERIGKKYKLMIMEKELQKVEIKDIPRYGLFIYRKEKWRSIGKLVEGSHSITAQKVFVNEYGSEVCVSNADFSEYLRVKPYVGDLDWLPKNKQGSISEYQRYLDIDRVHL